MTIQIVTLIELIDDARASGDEYRSIELGDLVEALKPFSDFPLESLTAKLRQVVLKKPVTKALSKKKAPAGEGGKPPTTRARVAKPKKTEAERQDALRAHIDRLKNAFDEDDAFGHAFELAKNDAALDAKSALALFESVIGPVNFPAEPPRKPSIFKQLREQRNTVVYRRDRTGQTSGSH